MIIWVVGANGLLGKEVTQLLEKRNIKHFASAKEAADITDLRCLEACAEPLFFTHIVNCAAFTHVDNAETQKEWAFKVNAEGPKNLGLIAKWKNARMVHISTDYVFSGDRDLPFKEEDAPSPLNYYGYTKLLGEKNLGFVMDDACIIRTSWLFGRGGKNFISSLVDLLQTNRELRVVEDQIGKPTFVADLAEAIVEMLDQKGVYHFANQGAASRYSVAETIMSYMQESGMPILCERLIRAASASFPTPARRPTWSVLCTEKMEGLLGRPIRDWKDTLPEFFYAACKNA